MNNANYKEIICAYQFKPKSSWQCFFGKLLLRFSRLNSIFDTELNVQRSRNDFEKFSQKFPFPEHVKEEKIDIDGIEAKWIYSEEDALGPIILYVHGGGYTLGSISIYRSLVAKIALSSKSKGLIYNYRLAPENPFPAGLEDSLTVYRWLLKQKIDPKKIVFAGDSAGGGLALAMLIALRDAGEPLPGGIICLAPWTDLTCTGETFHTKKRADPVLRSRLTRSAARMYLNGKDPTNPLISPLYADLHGLPPLLIQVGTEEILLSDSTCLAKKAADAGVEVTLEIWKDLFHVFQLFAPFIPESSQAIDHISIFVQKATEK